MQPDIERIVISTRSGMELRGLLEASKKLAEQNSCFVEFEFSGFIVEVAGYTEISVLEHRVIENVAGRAHTLKSAQ